MAQNDHVSAVEHLIQTGVSVNVENVVRYFVYCVQCLPQCFPPDIPLNAEACVKVLIP